MRGPLTLVIDDGTGPRHVTISTKALKFKRSAYGGDVDLTGTLILPRGFFTDLGPNDSLTLYHAASGAFMFRGKVHQPGVTAGPAGEVYELKSFGGAVRPQSITKALAYAHALDDGWKRVGSTKGAQVGEEEKNDGTPTQEVSWEKRFELEHNDQGQAGNRDLQRAGLKVGRVRTDWDAGRTDGDLEITLRTGSSIDDLGAAASTTATTDGGTLSAWIGGGGITVGHDVAGIRVRYTGTDLKVKADTGTGDVSGSADTGSGDVSGGHADTGTGDVSGSADTGSGDTSGGVPDKSFWVRFWDLTVFQMLKTKNGDDITAPDRYSGADANVVYAHEVIRDMLGRNMCPDLDMDKVTVGTFDYGIDALTWLDGITMGDALAALRVFEPMLTWQVYGDEANFDSWPTTPRYVISKDDGGVTHPGDDGASLADRVLVKWVDRRGRQQTTLVVVPVEGLDYAQEIDPIDLPDGVGSEANAQRAGQKALELHNNPPKAGTATVRRMILDQWTGAMVHPCEIMPGCLAEEQETGDVFWLTDMDYDDDAEAAVLTWGEPVRPTETVVARMERKQRRRK